MLTLVVVAILVLVVHGTEEKVLRTTIEGWHRDLLAQNLVPECYDVIEKHATKDYTDLSWDAQEEIMHCMVRDHMKKTGVKKLNATCDVLFVNDDDDEETREWKSWSQYGIMEKRMLADCHTNYLLMIQVRMETDMAWLPLDMLTNPYRKYDVALELLGVAQNILQQARSDLHETNFSALSDKEYRVRWHMRGLNVSHYSGIKCEKDLETFRATHSVLDYIGWNEKTKMFSPERTKAMFYQVSKDVGRILMKALTFGASEYFTNKVGDP